MDKKPDILATKVVASSRLFDIEQRHLRFSNGEERYFERICGHHHGSVMIVPLLDASTIVLVREYGTGVDDYVLGFPKGAMEQDEDLVLTAERELKEEAGYGARDLSVVAKFSASPGYMDSVMHVVIARELYPERIAGDEPEEIEVVLWSLTDVDALLSHPQFHEARSIAALFLVMREQHGKY